MQSKQVKRHEGTNEEVHRTSSVLDKSVKRA